MDKLNVAVIVGSTRPNRFSEKPAQWIFSEAKKRSELEVEVLDLRDYDMPFFDEGVSPSRITDGGYNNKVVKKWAKKIGEKDAYIIVSPEYNHSTSAVLKNAMDRCYYEWNQKAVGFVSYGSVGGGRAVEHLRLIAVELQMVPVRTSVHIPGDTYVWGGKEWKPDEDKGLMGAAKTMIDQVIWWGNAAKAARIAK